MPRSLNDWLLLVGATIAVLTCLFLAYYNITPDKQRLILLGTGIAFGCALIAVGSDLQASVTARFGAKANTLILQTWQGWASLVGWGAFTAASFHVVLTNPAWASDTFHFKVDDNLAWTGVAVGVSAIVIIRSKLAKVGSIEWGMEWVYLWSSAEVIDAVNKNLIKIKDFWEKKFKPSADDIAKYPTFFTDLEIHSTKVLNGKSKELMANVRDEIKRIRDTNIPACYPAPDATINKNAPARRYLVSAILDHMGHIELVNWAKTQGIAI